MVEISGGSPTQSTDKAAAISTSLLNRYNKWMVCTNFCKALRPIAGYGMYVYHYWQYFYDMGMFFSYENGTMGIESLDIKGFIEIESIHITPAKLVINLMTSVDQCFQQCMPTDWKISALLN